MGRIRIKKKGRVLPFRETVAYRFLIVGAALVLFAIALYQAIRALMTGQMLALAVAAIAAGAAAFLGLHNFSRMQTAKIPKETQRRMKRNR
jgi:hypothetical protein